jgi:hypothetical protein
MRLCALTLAVLLVGAGLAIAGGGQVRVITNCFKARVKPASILLACGDGSNGLQKLKWSKWTATGASGSGTNWYNTCTPNCARGKIKKVPVTVALSKPISCKGLSYKLFDKGKLKFTGEHGPHSTETFVLGCPIKS